MVSGAVQTSHSNRSAVHVDSMCCLLHLHLLILNEVLNMALSVEGAALLRNGECVALVVGVVRDVIALGRLLLLLFGLLRRCLC